MIRFLRRGSSILVLGLAASGLGLTACGDDAGPVDPLADCLEAAGVTGPVVAIRGFAFQPATLRVAPGTRVTWVNCESQGVDPHTSTADGGEWSSGLLFPDDTFARDFDETGTFSYHCVPHPSMQAEVIVQSGG